MKVKFSEKGKEYTIVPVFHGQGAREQREAELDDNFPGGDKRVSLKLKPYDFPDGLEYYDPRVYATLKKAGVDIQLLRAYYIQYTI